MNKNLYVINAEPVIKAFKGLTNGEVNVAMLQSKDFGISQSETEPLEGYERPKDFPFCCESHKKLFQIGVDSLAAFPDCCEAHKRLKNAKWFKKDNFSYLPLKLVTTISYTMHCVLKCINNSNWYNEITQYIDYTKQSYGQLPEGFGSPVGAALYLRNVKKNIEDAVDIPDDKKVKLLAYLNDYDKVEEPGEQAELNILIDYYKRWVKDFPFEISFFSHLKPHFESQIPILKEKVGENMYTGLVGYKLQSQKELIDFLVSTTQKVLSEINTLSLYEQGLITDIQKTKIELLSANRRLELKTLGDRKSSDRKQYIKILKQWFKGEKEFIKEITPFVKEIDSKAQKFEHEVEETMPFEPIDEDFVLSNILPFEIRLIYQRNYERPGGQRFIKVKGEGYVFFTEITTYYWFREEFKEGELYTEDLQPLTNESAQPYFKAYAEGFLKGYNEFDEKIKGRTAIFHKDEQSIVKKVFDFINTPIPGLSSYGYEWLDEKTQVKVLKKEFWYNNGIKAGEVYKAWFYVLNNYSYFIELFRTHKPYINLYHRAAKFWKDQPGGEGMYSHIIKLLIDIGETVEPVQSTSEEENDVLLSTIEDYLDPFKINMSKNDYTCLVQALKQYFETGSFPAIKNKIQVFGKVNIKKFGWALNQLYRMRKTGTLPIEYVKFGKENISLFADVEFSENNFIKSLLYTILR